MPGLATRWLTPRLSVIEETMQGAEIVLRAIDRLPDFSTAEADLMVGFGDFASLPEGAVPLVRPRLFPVASQAWIARNGTPSTLAELADAPLIHEESRQQWTDWFEAAGFTRHHALRGPRLWDANLGFDAAMAGQGIALVSRLTAGTEIANGSLVELFATDIRLGGYYLTAPVDRMADPLIGRFRDWIGKALAIAEAEPLPMP